MNLLGRLMQALRKACRSIKAHPRQTIGLDSRVFEVPPETFEHALMCDLLRWEINIHLDGAGLRNALKVLG